MSPDVVDGTDILYAAAAFAGPMIVTSLLVRGWDRAVGFDPIVYGAVVGIVSAALMSAARRAGIERRVVLLGLVAPMGFGVLAGLSGV